LWYPIRVTVFYKKVNNMSQIAGISSDDGDVADKLSAMLEAFHPQATVKINPSSKKRQWSVSSVVEDASSNTALAQVSLPIEGRTPNCPHLDCEGNLVLIYDGELYNSQEVASKLGQRNQLRDKGDTELLVYLVEELSGSLEERVREALKNVDGDYALGASSADQIVVVRDSLGTKPLYLAEGDGLVAFASNKRALWRIGLDNVMPLRAGTLAIFNSGGVKIKEALPLRRGEVEIEDMSQAVDCYQEAIYSAVEKRLSDVDKVGVLLSGGVDSCLIAKLVYDIASAAGIKVIAYTAGLPSSSDIGFAQEFAQEMGLVHKVNVLNISEVEEYIPKIIDTVEERDFVQVEAGIGVYAAMDIASQDGIKVLFSGQGPDELWVGYTWYPEVLSQEGRQGLSQRNWEDLTRGDIETLDRENKIARAHGAEMMFPYLDLRVVRVAMSVAPQLKVLSSDDHLGKHPHRQLAQRIGIPAKYANRSKDAAQHGTGIHSMLDEIAEKNGFDGDKVKNIGYSSDKITLEKLGSSERYGYRYAEKSLWQVPQNVQLFLDALAYKEGLLNKFERDRIRYFMEKI
jgi:asparagine synthase (glutamine-hydrolysing)